ncbi:acid-sensing ion channel 5-like isoform X2 [Argiope bruennichi]|uniref:acid-sensing ion channel 5-like isoform X2 n=1 Tax=Argiope bruennichi TaxID=94029 RepID=UPI0024952E99|nr:acid-sensing ion channel 5-like isoform X2 [Argiope bruennichi]
MSKRTLSTAQYMREVFQDSLITGIPQIILARSITRKVFKSMVLICSLIGFVYQTTEFLKIFWNYPTVLDIDVEYPEVIESPAITYCNLNGIKRMEFCKQFPDRCSSPSNRNDFCRHFPDFCSLESSNNLEFPKGEALQAEDDVTEVYLKEYGHLGNETLVYCQRISDQTNWLVPCSTNHTIHMMLSDGNNGYRNCYTLFSTIGSNALRQHTLPVPKRKEALFHLVFDMQPEEYFRPDREVGAIISIHSPNSLVNPFYDGFVIKPGNLYTVHLKMVEEKLLPSPYETQCQDYKSQWRMRGGKGPLNQEMCVAECAYNKSIEQCNCVVPGIIYHHDDRICDNDKLDECFHFNLSECYKICQQPCEFTDFEYDVQERKLEVKKEKQGCDACIFKKTRNNHLLS